MRVTRKQLIKRLTRGALKRKIFLLIGLVTLLAVTMTVVLASIFNYRSHRDSIVHEAELDLEMMAKFCEVALEFEGIGDLSYLETGFDSLMKDPSILAMVVYNDRKEVFAARTRPGHTNFTPPPFSREETIFRDDSIELHRPVLSANGELIGAVYMRHGISEIRERFEQFVKSGILAGFLAIVVALVMAVVVGRDIVQPVEQLSIVARKVGLTNDFSLRASHGGEDEIGQLVSQFNTMLERIEIQNKELNQAQDELELKIEERTRELDLSDRALNAAVNGVVITRIKDDKIIYCNKAMVQAFSWSKEELLDHSMRILQGADTGEEAIEKLSNAIGLGRECKVTLLQYRKDGTTLWNDVSIAPVLNSSGLPTHYIWILVDVTKALEEEISLRQARDEAEKANKAKSEFLSRMSHELRTPLNSIIGFSKLLSMSNLSGKVESNIKRIHQAGLHLLELINEVLDISRIETGHMSLNSDEINLQELLHEVVDLVRPMAKDLNVALVFPDQKHAGLKLYADKQRLRQVFLNLASNGIKYNRDGGSLTVYFEQISEDRVRIVFQNTGEGIPDSKLERLFQPFDRLDAESHHYQVEGTGLGLALSKKLIEAMGGEIWARSVMGNETRFFVELSLQNENGGEEESSQKAEFPSLSEPPKKDHDLLILYVEDNLDNLALVEQLVEQRQGFKLMSAIQGRQGYDLARQHVPDVIFLDLNLSDINGDTVLHLLKSDAKTRQIPVYMLSADAMISQIKRLKTSGAVDYLTKPIDITRFHQILDGILNA